jgi:hypothetical protein
MKLLVVSVNFTFPYKIKQKIKSNMIVFELMFFTNKIAIFAPFHFIEIEERNFLKNNKNVC